MLKKFNLKNKYINKGLFQKFLKAKCNYRKDPFYICFIISCIFKVILKKT